MRTRHAAMLVVLGVVGSAACSGGASGSRASTPEVDPACRGLQGPDAALCAVEAALARQPRNECIGAQLREMQRMAWAYRQALARAAAAAAQRATFEGLAGARPAPSDTPTEGAQPGGRAPDGTYTVRLDVLVRVAVENARDEERRSKMWAALVADAISERAGAAARCPASGGADGGVP